MFSSRTILIESNPELRSLLAQNLQMYCDTDITFRFNADDVTDHLKQDPDYQLIVCCSQVGDENTILKVYYYVKSQKLNIPIIMLGENHKIANEVEIVEDPYNWKMTVKKAAKILGVTAEKMAEKEMPDYYPVDMKNLLSLDYAPCFIYLKVGDSHEFFISAGEQVDKEAVQKLFLEGVKKVYIEKTWRLEFINAVSAKVDDMFKRARSKGDHVNVLSTALSNAQKLIRSTGLSSENIKMAKQSMNSMREVAVGTEGLSDLLAMLEANSDSYSYKHCMLTNVVAHQTIDNMEWVNKDQQEKMSFICFFHDITIPEDKLCEIHSEDELAKATITPEEKKRVKNHALNAVELLKDYPQIPFGVDSLILQHHGMLNGVGFSEEQNVKVSPMAITFRICEEFATMIIRQGKDFKFDAAIDVLTKKYDKKAYREVVNALAKINM